MTEVLPLADDFPAADEAAWRALVDKTLKGADFDRRLVSRTADGIAVRPLYAPVQTAAAPRRESASVDRPWDLRTRIRAPDPARANQEALIDLEGGAASLLLSIDPNGAQGVAVADQAGLQRVLDGVLLDLAPIALDAGWAAPLIADHLAALCPPDASPAFHLDPVSAFAKDGASEGPADSHLVATATTAVRLAGALPRASLFLASGRVVHESGGGEAQDLGFALASALTYLKALDRAGLPVSQAAPRIVLGLSADADYFVTIAKLRAARALWARLTAACGAPAVPAVIEARSSGRMLARVDPWVNLLRFTAAGFGAAAGGADAVILDTFTDALGRPMDMARRQARNIQLVLMEEAHVGRVSDPAGGSGYVEALTDQFARHGWGVFQRLERHGGVLRALEAGAFQSEVAAVRDQRRREVANRKVGLIGVSEFPNLTEAEVAVDTSAPTTVAPPATRRPGPDSACAALVPIRWAEPFEALRAKSAEAPVLIATLGTASEHGARLSFTTNLLAAGGLNVLQGGPTEGAGRKVAVLAGSDERYASEAVEAARILKRSGVRLLLLAGRPGDLEGALREAGVDGFIYAGGDVLADLQRIHDGLSTGAGG